MLRQGAISFATAARRIMPDVSRSPIDTATVGLGQPAEAQSLAERRRQETESRVAEISSLLNALEEAAAESQTTTRRPPAATRPPTVAVQTFAANTAAVQAAAVQTAAAPARAKTLPPEQPVDHHQNRLVQVRLGLASALFSALQHKHPATASHCLRVALGCSTWALYKRLDEDTRDVIEMASLLHDVGKISTPDEILSHPQELAPDDAALLERHWAAGVQILSCCCSSARVLDAVRYAGLRFDGTGTDSPLKGDELPLESRMIAIVDAFDLLTAGPSAAGLISRDQAVKSLRDGAGSLYDPILVKQFAELLSHDHDALTKQVAGHWLNDLGRRQSELPWSQPAAAVAAAAAAPAPAKAAPDRRALFEQQLIDSMHDGVIFVDEHKNVFMWSKGAERLTGVSSSAAMGRQFIPSLLDMCNTAGRRVRDDACPVARALASVAQLRQRLEILGRQGEHVAIDLHAIPVFDPDGQLQGATILLQDAQSEVSLEEKCEALHDEVTKDPMTRVANRAEFDRMLALFIEAHQQAGLPCSLIMSDIDHFKSINDTYGHQAGDEAIITVANLLKALCGAGDLVARYGGEEFAVLCADCNMADAAARAEQIRKKLSETPHLNLGNRRLTASFGVAQLQTGDTPETLLRRSDKALLMAKQNGRNQVAQLGGAASVRQHQKRKWWRLGFYFRSQPLVETTLTMEVPMNVAIEKLRGFVTDQEARITYIRDNRVELEISSEQLAPQRRRADRPDYYKIDLEFSEERLEKTNSFGLAAGTYAHTEARVTIRPKRRRNRRRADQPERARRILQRLKAYLMAQESEAVDLAPAVVGATA
jgi:diguanylate cyclase (GGDEF)-like protein/PAS domain S-box-containing protein